jgi:hypothetical protein
MQCQQYNTNNKLLIQTRGSKFLKFQELKVQELVRTLSQTLFSFVCSNLVFVHPRKGKVINACRIRIIMACHFKTTLKEILRYIHINLDAVLCLKTFLSPTHFTLLCLSFHLRK